MILTAMIHHFNYDLLFMKLVETLPARNQQQNTRVYGTYQNRDFVNLNIKYPYVLKNLFHHNNTSTSISSAPTHQHYLHSLWPVATFLRDAQAPIHPMQLI